MSTMCCRHCVHVSYSHASTSALRSSAVNVVVSVTYAMTADVRLDSSYTMALREISMKRCLDCDTSAACCQEEKHAQKDSLPPP